MGVNAYNERHNRLLLIGMTLLLLVAAVKLIRERREAAFPVDSAPNGQNVLPQPPANPSP